VVKAGPNIETMRMESRQTWIELAKVLPQMAQVAPDLLASLMDDDKADEIAKRLKATIPPQILGADDTPLPPEVQQAMQQAQGMMQQAQQGMQQLQQAAQAMEAEKREIEAEKAEVAAQKAELNVIKKEIAADAKVLQANERAAMAEVTLQQQTAMQPPAPAQIVYTEPPKRRVLSIVRQPDGSLVGEAVDVPMEQPQMPEQVVNGE
jgi:hypothetical protein